LAKLIIGISGIIGIIGINLALFLKLYCGKINHQQELIN
jgi:hypothetical protein